MRCEPFRMTAACGAAFALLLAAGAAVAQEPPPPAAAPPAAAPPPYPYPYPYPYAAPYPYAPYAAPPPTPEVMDYEEGQAIPPGYEVQSRRSKGLIIGGAVTFGAVWLVTVAFAAALQANAELDAQLTCSISGAFGGNTSCEPEDDYRPMYVPLVGPFIAMGTANPSSAGTAALAVSGVGQIGGLTMLILGFALPSKKLVRQHAGGPAITVAPTIAQGSLGAGIVGSF